MVFSLRKKEKKAVRPMPSWKAAYWRVVGEGTRDRSRTELSCRKERGRKAQSQAATEGDIVEEPGILQEFLLCSCVEPGFPGILHGLVQLPAG